MKSVLIVALAIGALVSTVLLVMEQLTDYSIAVMAWEMPGISAAYLFLGSGWQFRFPGRRHHLGRECHRLRRARLRCPYSRQAGNSRSAEVIWQ
ncbi:hypothetical protein [Bradyrhizobium sp. URHA0013]|uniref:hypothetical protein n=1 Tax=Bradyrhizobium sp. URHA0013 TaxID=1380352 RepID=UPI00352912A6